MQENIKKYNVSDIVLEKFRLRLSEYLDERHRAFPESDRHNLNIVLCTHVLPDGIGDLVNLNDFANFLEDILGGKVQTIIFIKDSVLPRASSIIEGRLSEGCYLIPYSDSDTEALKLTSAGRELVEQLIEKDILKDSDIRVHIATETQIPDQLVTELLTAKGIYSQKDWLRFFEIIPGPWQHRPQPPENSPFPLGTTWMGLYKEKNETGLKCDNAVRLISKSCLESPLRRLEYVNQNVSESSCRTVIQDALKQGDFIAAGYIHTVSTMQHYLQLLTKSAPGKRIVFVTNKLNIENVSLLQAEVLVEAGIGEIVFIRREQAEPNIVKLSNTGKQVCVLPMENFSNHEISTLLGIADATYAAGDTSIGQTISNMGIPFFDVIPNKDSFFTSELTTLVSNRIGEESSLYRYLAFCNDLSLVQNEKTLDTMINIILQEKESLLQEWQVLSDIIFNEYDAYVGFLEFLNRNMPTQLFIYVSEKLQKQLNRGDEVIVPSSISNQFSEFISYLVSANKVKLLKHLLDSKKLDFATILSKNDTLTKAMTYLSLRRPDEHLLLSFLQYFNQEEQAGVLSDLYLLAIATFTHTAWIMTLNDRVDIRQCDLVRFKASLEHADSDAVPYVTALFQPVLKEQDAHFLDSMKKKLLLQAASYVEVSAIPKTLESYFEPQKYTLWEAMFNIMNLSLYPEERIKFLNVLHTSPDSIMVTVDKLSPFTDFMDSEVSDKKVYDILVGYAHHKRKEDGTLDNERKMFEEALVAINQQDISGSDKEHLSKLLAKSVDEIQSYAKCWVSVGEDFMYTPKTCQSVHDILFCYAFHQQKLALEKEKSANESPLPSREAVGNAGFYKTSSTIPAVVDDKKHTPDRDEYKK